MDTLYDADEAEEVFRKFAVPCNMSCKFSLRLRRPEDGALLARLVNIQKVIIVYFDETKLIYEQKKIPAMIDFVECRELGIKNVAILLYPTMSGILTGARTTREALNAATLAAAKYSRLLRSPVELRGFSEMNIVYKMESPWKVSLKRIKREMGLRCEKRTRASDRKGSFPSARVSIDEADESKRVVIIIPASGMTIVTGCSELKDVVKYVYYAYKICERYQKKPKTIVEALLIVGEEDRPQSPD